MARMKSLLGVGMLRVELLGVAVSCSSVTSSRTETRVPREVTWGSMTVAATRRLSPRRSSSSSWNVSKPLFIMPWGEVD